jgi:hypothetical protein
MSTHDPPITPASIIVSIDRDAPSFPGRGIWAHLDARIAACSEHACRAQTVLGPEVHLERPKPSLQINARARRALPIWRVQSSRMAHE